MMKKIGVVLLGLVAAATCLAQNPDPFDFHVADFRLLTSKKVQADMGITKSQLDLMNKYADRNRQDINAYRQQVMKQGKDPNNIPNNDPTLERAFFDLKTSIIGVLTPAQLKRLRELTLQSVGMSGMLDGAVAKRVGLSAAQLKKAQEVFEAGGKKENLIRQNVYKHVIAPYKDFKPKTQQEATAVSQKVHAAFDAELKTHVGEIKAIAEETKKGLQAVIQKKQFAAYTALGGKPFVDK